MRTVRPFAAKPLRRFGLALALSSLLVSLAACTPEQSRIQQLIGESRVAAGLPGVADDATLDAKAQYWAQYLANTCTLSHSNPTAALPAGWRRVGENVGKGGSIESIHTAYMNSAGHKANILDPGFNRVGSGFAKCADGTVITVQEFVQM